MSKEYTVRTSDSQLVQQSILVSPARNYQFSDMKVQNYCIQKLESLLDFLNKSYRTNMKLLNPALAYEGEKQLSYNENTIQLHIYLL